MRTTLKILGLRFMRATMSVLWLCFISLGWSSCKEGPKFDDPHKSAQAKELKAPDDKGDSEDAEAAQQALEPVPIGGAYLTCRYEVVESNGEVWCRLEENDQPVLVKTQPTLENWVFMQNEVPYDATPFALDPSTGWQWAIKIPQDNRVDVSLDIFLNGERYHFSATISSMPPADDTLDDEQTPPPVQDKRYAYGNGASFVIDINPFSLAAPKSCLPPEGEAKKPDPTLPDLRFFLKGQSFTFPFKVVNDSVLTVNLDEVCGQMQPIHYAELQGVGINIRAAIPVGAKKITVAKSTALPAGDYELKVHIVPRSLNDLLNPESFAFGKVVLESSAELVPGRAYANEKK
jgi:hypothetical protein